MNSFFEGTAPGYGPAGLGFSGDGVRVATNRFSDMETGILLGSEDPDSPDQYLGIASNAVLIANAFCNVVTNVYPEDLASYSEDGTLTCPPPILTVRAVQLSWPYSFTGFSVETAPAPDGPWTTSDARPFEQAGQNSVVIPADSDQQFFRLRRP